MIQETLKHRQASFSFHSTGKGPAIIFLHGFLENQGMWKDIIHSLRDRFRCITIDLPGHGQSDCLGYIHTMEEMAEVVQALIHKLRLRKVYLCGHSMGGYVALAYAELFPDKIKGLILLNSTARADSAQKKKDRLRAIKLVKSNPQSFVRNSIPHLFRPKSREIFRSEITELKKEALHMSPRGIVAALEGMRQRPDREVILHLAPYPILFIAAEKDPVLPWIQLLEQSKAGKVKAVFTPNGHMSHIEDREEIRAALQDFLKGKG